MTPAFYAKFRWRNRKRVVASTLLGFVALLLINTQALANNSLYENCIIESVANSDDNITVLDIKTACARHLTERADLEILETRRINERLTETNRRALTPHQRNYLLPTSYVSSPNEKPVAPEFQAFYPDENLDNIEVKFQLSLKYRFASDVFLPEDGFYFGFTSLSFWQAYNSDVSAPFRETNYEPEIYWKAPIDGLPLNIDANEIGFGFSHQSNGQAGTLSRSWNRIYANITWEKGNYVFNFKPWYRIREDKKRSNLDPKGDDNPDIEKYLGHFEFTTVYRKRDHEVSLLIRNNLRSENRGAVQLDWTFPIWRGLQGHVQYFNGYGESLIDYNRQIERIGFGVLLSELF